MSLFKFLPRARPALFTLSAVLVFASQQGYTATTKDYLDFNNDKDPVPTGKGWGEAPSPQSRELNDFPGKGAPASKGTAGTTSNGINYHGGPLLNSSLTNIYYIWYGNWSGNTATTILTDFANHLNGSPYFNINTTYYDANKLAVPNTTGSLALNTNQVFDSIYDFGNSLSDSQIQQIVSSTIASKALPADSAAVYFVLTSSDVTASSGFCTKYCGWHTHASIAGTDIKYAFVGNPDRCPSACEDQTTSPNGNAGADGMASIIAHELEETVTDPGLNAWYDKRGYENADKCAWKFGTTSTAINGSKYNVTLGSREYLIQQNWVNAHGGYCSMSY